MKKGLCFALLVAIATCLSAEVHLRISKVEMTLSAYDNDSLLATYPISCGQALGNKRTKGDMKTPEGRFTIIEIVDSRYWIHNFGDGNGYVKNAYGPWFLRLSCGSGIGIHGTHDPESMGKRATEGCVRMLNDDIVLLKQLVKEGTLVEILPDKPGDIE